MAEKKEFLTYKGKPLVRQGNTIYYGDMADDYVIMMQILAKKEVGDKDKAEVASKVSVQLLSTDPNASMKERIIKTSEKKGLYAAMEWLFTNIEDAQNFARKRGETFTWRHFRIAHNVKIATQREENI